MTGPTSTAAREAHERGSFYVESLASRSWLFLLAIVPAVLITLALTSHVPLVAAVAVATGLLTGLSGGWFFVGEASPIRFLLLETLPRNLGTASGALALV